MNKAYLLTGGNEGDRYLNMQQARTNIEHICGQAYTSFVTIRNGSLGQNRPGRFSKPGAAD